MKCAKVRKLMLRKIDHELSESEDRVLGQHMEGCTRCIREYEMLSLPHRLAQKLPPLETSPYFYRKLRIHIENEAQNIAMLQQFFSLARKIIPSLAAITLALLSIFAYFQLNNPKDDLYSAYEQILTGEDIHNSMMLTGQRNITDVSILRAIARQETQRNTSYEMK
jgi:hypothetical protein